MRKKGKIALICCIAAVPVLLIAAFLLVALPYINAASSMPEGASLSLTELGSDCYTLTWPEGTNAGSYHVVVSASGNETPLFDEIVEGLECSLEDMSGTVTISITPRGHYSVLGFDRFREGEALTVQATLKSPGAPTVGWSADDAAQTLTASYDPGVGLSYELLLLEDDGTRSLSTAGGGTMAVTFGEGRQLTMPEYGEPYSFAVRAVYRGEGYTLTGLPSESYELEREALLPDTTELSCESTDTNRYTLTWTEAKGDYYEIQRADGGDWVTLGTVSCTDELAFDTGTLGSLHDYSFRVMGYDDGAEEAVSSSEAYELTTERSPIYCTVWPLTELAVFADSGMAEKLDVTAAAATALCVLDEENGMFNVRIGSTYGWIESNYCMINLPEYLGELLAYDITNSYASKYMIHGYEIPEVTDTVIKGYENVQLAEGMYLVPYLYPCCEKLYNAATAALADGYRLKIYDSYRPGMATRYIYDTAEAIIDTPLPETDFYGEVPEDLPEAAEGQELTYRALVTEGNYGLPNFLAQNGSYHNMGIALDLTLERADTGEELEMQTDMHDLSIYSILARNNDEAVLLDGYMKAAGFGGLTSEWWHFQDNETRDTLGLRIYMQYGVSCAGFTADDTGWRYRTADGSFLTDTTTEIGGVSYTFDENGYCELREQSPQE